jgi:hypothetical protein
VAKKNTLKYFFKMFEHFYGETTRISTVLRSLRLCEVPRKKIKIDNKFFLDDTV